MIEIEGLHHVSLPVTDLERAKRFYGETLGLGEIDRPGFEFPGAWYRIGDRQLHLIVHPGAGTFRGTGGVDSRDGHLALRVADYGAAVERLKARGCEIREKPVNRTPWAQVFVTDPDGNVIELNAPAPN